MFLMIRESWRLNKFPNRRLLLIFALIFAAADFLFYQFPIGNPHIAYSEQLLQLDFQQLLQTLQKLQEQHLLQNIITFDNWINIVANIIFRFILILLSILFVSWQISSYRHMANGKVLWRFLSGQWKIWAYFVILLLIFMLLARLFIALPTLALVLLLFFVTQYLFVPILLADKGCSLSGAYFMSRKMTGGFKLNILANLLFTYVVIKSVPFLILLFLPLPEFVHNILNALINTLYILVTAKMLYIYYFYLTEYFYPQIRSLGLIDSVPFWQKLNSFVYPFHSETEKGQLLKQLREQDSVQNELEQLFRQRDFADFKQKVLEVELPLKKEVNSEEKADERESGEQKSAGETLTPADKYARVLANRKIIKEKLQALLQQKNLILVKAAYLDNAVRAIEENLYSPNRSVSINLQSLINNELEHLQRCEQAVAGPSATTATETEEKNND